MALFGRKIDRKTSVRVKPRLQKRFALKTTAKRQLLITLHVCLVLAILLLWQLFSAPASPFVRFAEERFVPTPNELRGTPLDENGAPFLRDSSGSMPSQ